MVINREALLCCQVSQWAPGTLTPSRPLLKSTNFAFEEVHVAWHAMLKYVTRYPALS